MQQAEIGIIGGSGLYSMPGLTDVREVALETPFGAPSDAYVLGTLAGRKVAFLARHGRGHRFMPTELNYRANIHGHEAAWVSSGSFRSPPSARSRKNTAPLTSSFPISLSIAPAIASTPSSAMGWSHTSGLDIPSARKRPRCSPTACRRAGVNVKQGGTYLNMEGPQFSTKAESNLYRSWGMDVIGMTNLTEARLAREAELCYVTVAMVTDYDCWHEEHDHVTVDQIVARAAEERGARVQRGARSGDGDAEDARLQVRFGAEERHHHPEERCASRHAGAPEAAGRQVFQLRTESGNIGFVHSCRRFGRIRYPENSLRRAPEDSGRRSHLLFAFRQLLHRCARGRGGRRRLHRRERSRDEQVAASIRAASSMRKGRPFTGPASMARTSTKPRR